LIGLREHVLQRILRGGIILRKPNCESEERREIGTYQPGEGFVFTGGHPMNQGRLFHERKRDWHDL